LALSFKGAAFDRGKDGGPESQGYDDGVGDAYDRIAKEAEPRRAFEKSQSSR
jgi:hypothetical protein